MQILEEETLSVIWGVCSLVSLIIFYFVCFSYQTEILFGSFADFLLLKRCSEKAENISMNNLGISIDWDYINYLDLLDFNAVCISK